MVGEVTGYEDIKCRKVIGCGGYFTKNGYNVGDKETQKTKLF